MPWSQGNLKSVYGWSIMYTRKMIQTSCLIYGHSLASLPSKKPPHLHHQAKKTLGGFQLIYSKSIYKSIFYKIRRKVKRKTEYMKRGRPFPRNIIINQYKLGALRQQNLFSHFWRLKAWNRILAGMFSLWVFWERIPSCLFQLVEAAGVSWLWQHISNMRSSSLVFLLRCLRFLFFSCKVTGLRICSKPRWSHLKILKLIT